MNRLTLFWFILACVSLSGATNPGEVPLLGHNLTPTTYGLPKGKFTLGTYAVGYGVTDHWTIGTSPWLIVNYNMPTLSNRFTFDTDGLIEKVGFDFNYFKTFPYGFNIYLQESIFARLTASRRITENYSLTVSAGYQYFFDASIPFSLCLRPGNRYKQNFSVSTLQELLFTRRLGVFLEMGVLGLNYPVPYLHLGASAFWRWSWGYVQAGLSRSSSFDYVTYDFGWHGLVSDKYFSVLVHPEIQFQTYF